MLSSTENLSGTQETTRDASEINQDENVEEEKPSLFDDLAHDNIELSEPLLDKAKKMDGKTLWYIGSLYRHQQKYEKAVTWLQLAMENKSPHAYFTIGSMYAEGQFFEADPLAAMSWYLKAANLGELESRSAIANMFEKGLGIPENGRKATDWYIQSGSNTLEDDGYVNISQREPPIEDLIIESMQILEEERERRWQDELQKLQSENQSLNEEVLSLRELVNDIINSSQQQHTRNNSNMRYEIQRYNDWQPPQWGPGDNFY